MPTTIPIIMKNICLYNTCIYSHLSFIKMINIVVDIVYSLIVTFIVLNLCLSLIAMYSALKY